MVTVRFFGTVRMAAKRKEVEIEASTVGEVLGNVSRDLPGISLNELKSCIILVNGTNITEFKAFETVLKDEDEVAIFSPAAGG